MQIKKPKSPSTGRRRTLYVTAGLIIALAGAGAYVWYKNKTETSDVTRAVNSVDYGQRTEEDQRQSDAKKQEIINQAEKQDKAQTNTEISVIINRFSQIPNGEVQLRSVVTGASAGSCSASFSKDTTSFTKQFDLVSSGSYMSCNLDLSASDFPESGTWKVSLVATAADGTSSSAVTSTAEIKN